MSTSVTALSYSLEKSEFTLSIKNATKATYIIEYQAKKDKDVVTEALTGQLSGKGTLSATHFAGTESAGAKVPHVVTGGTLKATITAADGSQDVLTRVFTISEKGQLKIVSESSEKSAAGSVLGASTEDMSGAVSSASALAIPRAVATPRPATTQEQTTSQLMETTEDTPSVSLDIPVMPLAIGGGLLLLAGLLFVMWSMSRGKSTTATSSAPDSTSAPTPTVPQNPTMPQA